MKTKHDEAALVAELKELLRRLVQHDNNAFLTVMKAKVKVCSLDNPDRKPIKMTVPLRNPKVKATDERIDQRKAAIRDKERAVEICRILGMPDGAWIDKWLEEHGY